MLRAWYFVLFIVLALLLGCGSGTKREPAIGEAFVSPATLSLRQDLGIRSTTVATVSHGERLEILRTRRRFVRVRTSKGIEGWTDSRLLLSPEQMAEIRRFSEQSSNLPSQGKATVYSTLNVHIQPSRQSGWFTQVKEKQLVDVLARRIAPRVTEEPKSAFAPPAPKQAGRKPPPKKPTPKIPPPPLPKPPQPPLDWLQLSTSVPPPPKPPATEPEAKPVPLDEWSLIKTPDGKVGWVLARMLVMAIPDEVAQYSEGRRITAYFSLGTVQDEDRVKHNWVWTTLSDSLAPYDFDGFRVFIYSLRHHRYETAYIERHVEGFYPVEAHPVQTQYNKKPITAQGFSVITKEDDGALYRRTFVLIGHLIYPAGTTRWEVPPEKAEFQTAASARSAGAAGQSFFARLKQKVKSWFGK